MKRQFRALVLTVVVAIALTACRLDVDVSVVMEADGTGSVTVDLVADAELMQQVPDLMNDLRLDDAIANGWSVTGPTATEDGGATLALTHSFSSAQELANVLNSIGPPLSDVGIARTVADDQTTNAIDATLALDGGWEAFADSDLIAAAGGMPFGLDASGVAPSDAMSFTLDVKLPGELMRAETGTDIGNEVIQWEAPLDGSSLAVRSETVQRPAEEGASWAAPVSTVASVLFVAWCVIATGFIVFVIVARRRKAQRRQAALKRLERR